MASTVDLGKSSTTTNTTVDNTALAALSSHVLTQADTRYAPTSGSGNYIGATRGRNENRRKAAALPLIPVGNRPMWCNALSNGTDTAQNSEVRHIITTSGVSEVRLMYVNAYGTDNGPGNPITVTAGFELADGSVLPVYFNGQTSVTIANGGYVLSDPVPCAPAKGDKCYSRTYVSVATAGQKWPIGFNGYYTVNGSHEGGESGTAITDKSKSGTIPTTGGVFLYGPAAVIGRAGSAQFDVPTIGLTGDSRMFGQGEDWNALYMPDTGLGYGERALNNNFGQIVVPMSGESAGTVVGSAGAYRIRSALLQGVAHVVCNYMINDVKGSVNAATIQANMLSYARKLANMDIKVWWTTCEPWTTSTDNFLTLTGQTVNSNDAARTATNDWLRDGAPINSSGTAVAVGTNAAGTLRAGQAGHPMAGYFEVADTLESARNSGKWKIDSAARTVTDGSISASSNSFTSATANFTSADRGRYLIVAGAGASGGQLIARIDYVNSATNVGLGSQASTAVTGATSTVQTLYTGDGTHPRSSGHAAAATAIDTTKFTLTATGGYNQ